jgi:3-oxoacyl-[acyl-carrier-protein] synthase-3
MGSVITGTGIAIPPHVVTNDDLAAVMDTSDEWIVTRSGVRERRFVEPGITTSDLAAEAGRAALDDAGLEAGAVDAVVTATMTPDLVAPGIAGLVQARMGLGPVPVYDIRAQCSGFLYALDLADALLRSGKARRVLVAGAEVHSGYLPWDNSVWAFLRGESATPPGAAARERASRYRDWSVLFGDGAGAAIVEHGTDLDAGLRRFELFTDGRHFDLIMVPGVGFKYRPYVDTAQLEAELHLPTMRGRHLFKQAVTLMPQAVRAAAASAGIDVSDIDLVIAHQANARIVDAVARELGAGPEVVPVNIGAYGNTTAGTLPILFHEMRTAGRVPPGAWVCFTAFGAGAHWGAVLYREPSTGAGNTALPPAVATTESTDN